MVKTFQHVVASRFSRRGLLKGGMALGALGIMSHPALAWEADTLPPSNVTFPRPPLDNTLHLYPGHTAYPLAVWGDALKEGLGAFDPRTLTPEEQQQRIGYNCDYLGFFPLPEANRALLTINHEFPSILEMFPGLSDTQDITEQQTRTEMAALGVSVVEIEFKDNKWRMVTDSSYNRRLDALTTRYITTGAASSIGEVTGMMANCAGGITPWGTLLTCEENFNLFFTHGASDNPKHRRYGLDDGKYPWWGKYDTRFDLKQQPNTANHFGWVVEIDPYNPQSTPKKRTSLGRFKHETATLTVANTGQVVVYSGDDDYFEYLYKYVSRETLDTGNKDTLLDDGTLYVARFDEDGGLIWLPLVYGMAPLTKENGFDSQADVVTYARLAGDLLNATQMDRPEGIAVAADGKVYVALTKNFKRARSNAANPRPFNMMGHIVVLTDDQAGTSGTWDILMLGGDPGKLLHRARYPKAPKHWLACPDNLTVDAAQNLWIATDGATKAAGIGDGLYVCPLTGDNQGQVELFLQTPKNSEPTGPCFAPDNKTLFLSIQHPSEGGDIQKPTVMAIAKDDGGTVGV
jgi:uncharacterized protein